MREYGCGVHAKMMMRKWVLAAALALALGPGFGWVFTGAVHAGDDAAKRPWSVELKVKKYFASHTSYEFADPYTGAETPLSRLEFPLNTWWAAVEFKRSFPRFSAGFEIARNFTRDAGGSGFKDSDWQDSSNPDGRTDYGVTDCRMDPSYTVRGDLDLKIADWVGLPSWIDLRPVVGIRWQRFSLMAHDGTQQQSLRWGWRDFPLPGDCIEFEQTYWHYFLGVRGDYDLGRHLGVKKLRLRGQWDWARVEGKNEDRHLLRGDRLTEDTTRGHAWHGNLGLVYEFAPAWTATLETDYMKIKTTGSHYWWDSGYSLSWENGVRVWSEQLNMTLGLAYSF